MSDSAISIAMEFVRAINRQNVDALASLMTADHRFTDSLGNAVDGRDAIRAGWSGYSAWFRIIRLPSRKPMLTDPSW